MLTDTMTLSERVKHSQLEVITQELLMVNEIQRLQIHQLYSMIHFIANKHTEMRLPAYSMSVMESASTMLSDNVLPSIAKDVSALLEPFMIDDTAVQDEYPPISLGPVYKDEQAMQAKATPGPRVESSCQHAH